MTIAIISILISISPLLAQAQAQLSARSPEVLASYASAPEFLAGVKNLNPKIQSLCESLLESQLRLQKETDSWKLYSLYEALSSEQLMTAELVRVPTVTEVSGSLPRYTGYRVVKNPNLSLQQNADGSILVVAPGAACGPDPLAVTKGAYFVKCGSFLIGSGLIRINTLKVQRCLKPRILINPFLRY